MRKTSRGAIWYDHVPNAEKDKAAVLQYMYWQFPDQRKVDELRDRVSLIRRDHLDWLERDGHGETEAARMFRAQVSELEAEIATLLGTGRFPR
jgi:hypothetical protein